MTIMYSTREAIPFLLSGVSFFSASIFIFVDMINGSGRA